MVESITCNLAENALDYLILAGEQAKLDSPRMRKHAIATLADGVELLLKARLEIKDWCLIFKDVDQATRTKYESGDFQSVTFDQAVTRLENLCSVQIAKSHRDIIDKLRQLRNRIRHFAVTTENSVAISLIVKTLSFAIEFVTEHLHSILDKLAEELGQLRTLLGDFAEFVDSRMAEVKTELEAAYCVVLCPVCLQDALKLGDGDVTCAFCRHKADGESAAVEWVECFFGFQSPKDSLIEPQIEECPECGAQACVNVGGIIEDDTGYVCFSCGLSGDYEYCSDCGQLFSGDDSSRCSDCWENLMSKND